MIRIASLLKGAITKSLRLLFLCIGAWTASVLPVAYFADIKRDMNAAVGHMPNMDPGINVSFATISIVPIFVALVVIELFRSWAWEKKPLALPSYFVLGLAAAWPIGVAISSSLMGGGNGVGFLLACPVSVAVFYVARHRWIARPRKLSPVDRRDT